MWRNIWIRDILVTPKVEKKSFWESKFSDRFVDRFHQQVIDNEQKNILNTKSDHSSDIKVDLVEQDIPKLLYLIHLMHMIQMSKEVDKSGSRLTLNYAKDIKLC
jgi:hypothetical protein